MTVQTPDPSEPTLLLTPRRSALLVGHDNTLNVLLQVQSPEPPSNMETRRLPQNLAPVLINQTLDEVLAEQEGDFDADSRWALAWFEQMGFNDGEFGLAETLSKAKNTSVAGLVDAGILGWCS